MTQPSNILSNEKMEFNSGDPPLEHYYEHPFFWKVSKIEKILIAAGIALNNSKKKDKSESNPATNLTSDGEATKKTNPAPKRNKRNKNKRKKRSAAHLDSAAEASETKIPKLEEGKDKPQTNPVANVDSGVDASTNTITEPQNATNESQPDPDNLVFDSMAKENLILGDKNDWKIRLDEIEKLTRSDELIEVDSICYYLTTNFGNKEPLTWEKAFERELKNEKMKELKEKLNEKTSRLSELVICVRDKLAHLSDLPQSGLKKLGFIEDPPTNFKSKQFVQNIIINGFPSLVAFVGIQKAAKDDLGDLYKYRETLKYHPKNFLNQMETALQEHKSRGGLKKRYKAKRSTGEEITLEFRWAKDMKLTSNTMAAVVGEEEMKILWIDEKKTEKLTYALSSKSKLNNVTIVFADKAENVDLKFLENHCAGNRIIILAKEVVVENLKKVVDTISRKFNSDFVEADVEWKEVEDVCKKNVLEQKVKFHEYVISLKQFLPQVDSNIIGIFEKLKGDELNEVLRGVPFKIFDKCKLPDKPSIYLPRKLRERATLIAEYIKAKNNILIVFGASYGKVSNLFRNTTQQCEQVESQKQGEIWKHKFRNTVSEETRVFVMEEHVETSREMFDAIKEQGWEKDYNIHFLNYVEKNRLIPLESIGTKLTENLKAQNDCFAEYKLLDEISDKVRAVMVADQPGMGKTYLMRSLANILTVKNAHKSSECALLDIEKFVQEVEKNSKTGTLLFERDDIIYALTELLCSSDFKKQIAKMWLNENAYDQLKMDIIFDGLDEAKPKSRAFLIKAIKLIAEQLPTIRVWVAMRDHVHQDVQNIKNVVHIKIMPFSEDDQIDYIEKELWKYKLARTKPTGKVLNAQEEEKERRKIREVSKNCMRVKVFENDVDIAGIPLQCYIISQVYAERVLANNFTLNENFSTTIAQLYNGLIYRKFWIFLRKIGFNTSEEKPEGQFFRDNYKRMLHQLIYYALKLIISEKVASWFQKTIHLEISKSEEFTSDILSYGLIESLEPLQFVHRTFAEFLVAMLFYLVLTDSFDSRIQRQDTDFRRVLREEVLKFTEKITDFKYPNVARFLESCLAHSVSQADAYPHESYLSVLSNVQAKLTNERINLAMSHLLYDQIQPSPYIEVESREQLSKYFQIKVSKLNFFQHLLVIAAENKDDDFCGDFRFYLQNKKTHKFQIFPNMSTNNLFERVAESFVNKSNLFLVQPTSKTKETLKWILDIYAQLNVIQCFSGEVNNALEVLIFDGDLNQSLIVDWVNFFLTELIPSVKVKFKQTLLHDLTLNAIYSVGESEIISKHSLEIWKSLVKYGCCPRSRNAENQTPFHLGAKSCTSKDMLFFIDELGCYKDLINEKDSNGNTLLLLAANNENCTVELIQKLNEIGGDVSIANDEGQTCLMLAVKNNRLDIVKLLVEIFANAELRDRYGNNAADPNQYLIGVGSYINKANKKGQTCLMLAVKNNRLDIVELLFKLGVDANLKDNNGDTAVAYVGRYGSSDCSVGILKYMVENSVDIATQNKLGQNVLHIACKYHNLNLVRFLVKGITDNKFNMSLDQKDKSKRTALHHAVPRFFNFDSYSSKYNVEVALELIKAGPKMKTCFVNSYVVAGIVGNIQKMKKIVVEEHKYSEECNCEFHCRVRDIENGKILNGVEPTTKREFMDLFTLIYISQEHILYMTIKKIVLESEYRISYDRIYELWKIAKDRLDPERYPKLYSEIKKNSSHSMDED